MALSKFRNDFRRAVNRTTVSLFLTASLLTPLAVAGAQQQAAPADTPAAVTETAQAPAETITLQNGVVLPVSLQQVEDTKAMVAEYPFLAEKVQTATDFQEQTTRETTFMTGKAHDPETKTNFLFVYAEGSYFCGSQGCSMSVYTDTGKGFVESFSAIAPPEFYVGKTQEGKSSIFFCGSNDQRSEWQLNGDKFEIQKTPSVPVVNNKPLCSSPGGAAP